MELKGKKINFLGDSITAGVGATVPEKIFLNVLKEREGLAEARNYGYSGTRIANQRGENYGGPYVTRYAVMDDDADIVVVFGGTNDYGHGTAQLGAIEDRSEYTFYGAMHLLIERLAEKFPTATIVFMTPIPRSAASSAPDPERSFTGATMKEYVDAIKEVAAYHAIPVLDLYTMSGFDPNIEVQRKIYCPDGLHPSDAGNERIASRLAGFLKSL